MSTSTTSMDPSKSSSKRPVVMTSKVAINTKYGLEYELVLDDLDPEAVLRIIDPAAPWNNSDVESYKRAKEEVAMPRSLRKGGI